MKTINNRKYILVALLLFLGALYLCEFSPFSSRAVALVNSGYGTFDMKKYDAEIYLQVMNATTDFSAYWKYYMTDFIFIAAFLNFMVQLVRGFSGKYSNLIKRIAYVLAIARGLLDAVENIMLMYLIYEYPNADIGLVSVCNIITRVKFLAMRGWILCFIILSILGIIQRRRNFQ